MQLRKESLWYLSLAAIAFVVYARTLQFPLLWWDDREHICINPFLNALSLQTIWTQPYFGLFAPLSYTLWMIPLTIAKGIWSATNSCFDMGPVFHSANIFFHIANTLLVFYLLKNILKEGKTWIAFLGALLFCIHPLQVESVAWVSSFRDLLSACMGLAGLAFFIKQRKVSATLFFVLSLLAKPSGLIFPLMAALLVFEQPKEKRRSQWFTLIPSFIFSIIAGIFAKTLQADSLLKFESPLWQRPLIYAQAIGFYIWKFFIPFPLAPDYGRSVLAINENPILLWPGILVLALIGTAIFFRRLLLPVAWVVIALLPYSSLVSFGFQEISTVADRYFYISMFGCAWILGIIAFEKIKPLIAIVLIALSGLTIYQTGYWQSDEVLFTHTAEVNPRSSISYGNLGNIHFHQQNYNDAERDYRQSVELDAKNKESWLGLARTFEKNHKNDEAEILYRKSIAENLSRPETFNNLAVIAYQKGNRQEAEDLWKKAAELSPLYFEPRYNLGVLTQEQNRLEKAKKYFLEAQKISPQNPLVAEKLKLLSPR